MSQGMGNFTCRPYGARRCRHPIFYKHAAPAGLKWCHINFPDGQFRSSQTTIWFFKQFWKILMFWDQGFWSCLNRTQKILKLFQPRKRLMGFCTLQVLRKFFWQGYREEVVLILLRRPITQLKYFSWYLYENRMTKLNQRAFALRPDPMLFE